MTHQKNTGLSILLSTPNTQNNISTRAEFYRDTNNDYNSNQLYSVHAKDKKSSNGYIQDRQNDIKKITFQSDVKFNIWSDSTHKNSLDLREVQNDTELENVTERSNFAGQERYDTGRSSIGIVLKWNKLHNAGLKNEENNSFNSVGHKVNLLKKHLDMQEIEEVNIKHTNEENISETEDRSITLWKYFISMTESEETNTGTAKGREKVTTALGCSDNFSNNGYTVEIEHDEIKFTSRSEVDLTKATAITNHRNVDVPACKEITINDSTPSKRSSKIAICSSSGKLKMCAFYKGSVNKMSYDSFELLSDGNDIVKLAISNTVDKEGKGTIDSKISRRKSHQSLSEMAVENKHLKRNVSINKSNSGGVIDKSKLCDLFFVAFLSFHCFINSFRFL